MQALDAGPTLYSAGGGDASTIIKAHSLDGMDVWPSILSSAIDAAIPSPRTDILLHLQGPNNGHIPPVAVAATLDSAVPSVDGDFAFDSEAVKAWEKTAALRMGKWKVVVNQVESPCPQSANITANPGRCLNRVSAAAFAHLFALTRVSSPLPEFIGYRLGEARPRV